MGGDALGDPGHELVGIELASGDDDGDGDLTAVGVGRGHDGGVGDMRVGGEQGLELGGGDLRPPTLISSLSRSTIHTLPSRVHVAQVAGAQPAVGVDQRGGGVAGGRGSPAVFCGPRTHSSPSWSGRARAALGIDDASSVLGMTRPTEPGTVPARGRAR